MRGFVRPLGSANAARQRLGTAASHSSGAMPIAPSDCGIPTAVSNSSMRANRRSRAASSPRPPSPSTQAIWAYFWGAT